MSERYMYDIEEDPEFIDTLIKALKRRMDRLEKQEQRTEEEKDGD